MERTERLNGTGWLFRYEDTRFPPGTDSFLLSSFPKLKPGMQVLDLGAGSGLLGMLLLRRCPTLYVCGVELDPEAAALGVRNAEENGLADRLQLRQGDLRELSAIPANTCRLVVCNPPYFPVGSGASAPDSLRRSTREEVSCSLQDICAAAARALTWSGSLCIVHKPERLTDLMCTMRAANIEPKRLRFVQNTAVSAPSLILVEGRLGGKPGLQIEPPLLLQQADGSPTVEVNNIYYRTPTEVSI